MEKYIINKDGTIYSKRYKKNIKTYIHRGYEYATLIMDNGKKKNIRVNRLIAETFLQNPNNLSEVDHKDHNKLNNAVTNLQWINQKDNLKRRKFKSIMCIETGNTYSSSLAAEKELGIFHIKDVCNGVRKTAGGFHWRYK